MFVISERWKSAYPNAMVAVLVVRGARNTTEHADLERMKRALEAELHARFRNPDDIKSLREIRAYTSYYKRFGKTYHLAQQLKTIAIKRKPLPTVSALVDVMFMAEMKNFLLTAAHDLATMVPPVTVDAGTGTESYTKLSQELQVVKQDDMMVVDTEGVLSTVIHGPDYRSRITLHTSDAAYVVYAPDGIQKEQVCRHLRDIKEGVLLFSPSACVECARVLSAYGVEDVEV